MKLVVAPQWKFGNFFGNLKKILGLNRRGYFDFFFLQGSFRPLGSRRFFAASLQKNLLVCLRRRRRKHKLSPVHREALRQTGWSQAEAKGRLEAMKTGGAGWWSKC